MKFRDIPKKNLLLRIVMWLLEVCIFIAIAHFFYYVLNEKVEDFMQRTGMLFNESEMENYVIEENNKVWYMKDLEEKIIKQDFDFDNLSIPDNYVISITKSNESVTYYCENTEKQGLYFRITINENGETEIQEAGLNYVSVSAEKNNQILTNTVTVFVSCCIVCSIFSIIKAIIKTKKRNLNKEVIE